MKRRRFLPEHVTKFKDRHGKLRYRYRRAGYPGGYFKAEFGTEEFRAEYAAFARQGPAAPEPVGRTAPGTVAALVSAYVSVPSRLGPSATTQRKIRTILDRFREEYGSGYVADLTFEHVDIMVAKRLVKVATGKRPEGGPEAARKFRKELVRLFDFAMKKGMRKDNPVRQAERVKIAPGERSKGYHSWTEEEIQQFYGRHQRGTYARLAMDLMLWTGQRRGDAITIGPRHVRDGVIRMDVGKTGVVLDIPIAPQLLATLTAMEPRPTDPTFLINGQGRPFTNAGFGNWFRERCDEAGLPQCTAHGLRKAAMRRMADLGMANRTMKSVSGHSKDREVAIYTEAANQAALAVTAIRELSEWESNRSLSKTSNPSEKPHGC